MSLTVMTFNILNGRSTRALWPRRRQAAARLIADAAPDFCGLQEAFRFQLRYLLKSLPRYAAIGQGRGGGTRDEHSAILYEAERWELCEHEDFWLSEAPNKPGSTSWDSSLPRMVTLGRFREKQTDLSLTVANTHFDHRGKVARRESAELLRRRLLEETDPAVAMGDFNDVPGSAPHEVLTGGDPPRLFDAWDLASSRIGPEITFHNWGEARGSRIDWILYSGDLDVQSVEVVTGPTDKPAPSDHYPVLATLRRRP